MMEESKRISWTNLATEHLNLRYPTINLGVFPAFNINHQGKIMFETFVQSKNKEMLTLIRDEYHTDPGTNIFEALERFKKAFNHKCELTKDKFIFNKEWSIYEPYEINKL